MAVFDVLHYRKCSVLRLDKHGNQYAGACTSSADTYYAHSSNVHHGSAPALDASSPESAPSFVMEEAVFLSEDSSSFSTDHSEPSTDSPDRSSDMPRRQSQSKDMSSQHALPNLVSLAQELFHLSSGPQPPMHSYTPTPKKVLA